MFVCKSSFQTKFQPLKIVYGYLQTLLILLHGFSQIVGFSTNLLIKNVYYYSYTSHQECTVLHGTCNTTNMAATGQEMVREKRA